MRRAMPGKVGAMVVGLGHYDVFQIAEQIAKVGHLSKRSIGVFR